MNTSRLKLLSSLLMMTAVLSGCANMSGVGGSSEFHCAAPGGIPCRSVSGVDQAIRAGQVSLSPQPAAPAAPRANDPGLQGSRMDDTVPSRASLPRYLPVSGAAVDDEPGLGAIRSEPTVIRIWIAPYEDGDGDLHEASRVYLQIDNGRWLIQHNQERIRREFAPKNVRQVAAAAAPQTRTAASGTGTPAMTTVGQRDDVTP